jgi:RNA polymerase sigma-70 factor, ECF subfamily
MRVELVSTLYYLPGNYDDAQDAAQETFLKYWRGLDGVLDVRNLQAWIFRVGLNAAKDLRRNAWRRRALSHVHGGSA